MTTGETVALTRWTFVGKVMSLFFNMLCRLVIAFFARSKHLLISWLQSPSLVLFSSVQSLSRVRLLVTPWITACQDSLSITNSRSLLRLKSTESVMPSSHLILCCPLLLPLVPPSIRVFSNESTFRMRWPKYQNGLVGSPCSPRDSQEFSPMPQFKSINSLVLSLLYGSISHSYMTTGKTIALTMALCQQSDIFAFQYAVKVCHSFPSKEQASFNFMTAEIWLTLLLLSLTLWPSY